MGKILKQTFFKEDIQMTNRYMSIPNLQENAQWNSELPPHTCQDGYYLKQKDNKYYQGWRKRERLCIVVNCYSHYGKQYGGSSKNLKRNYNMIQQSHYWVFSKEISQYLEKTSPPHVHYHIIHNSQDVEMIYVFTQKM